MSGPDVPTMKSCAVDIKAPPTGSVPVLIRIRPLRTDSRQTVNRESSSRQSSNERTTQSKRGAKKEIFWLFSGTPSLPTHKALIAGLLVALLGLAIATLRRTPDIAGSVPLENDALQLAEENLLPTVPVESFTSLPAGRTAEIPSAKSVTNINTRKNAPLQRDVSRQHTASQPVAESFHLPAHYPTTSHPFPGFAKPEHSLPDQKVPGFHQRHPATNKNVNDSPRTNSSNDPVQRMAQRPTHENPTIENINLPSSATEQTPKVARLKGTIHNPPIQIENEHR
tara:strand:+ start:329 stop:1174 length:846 start_codon:yes stop_codon:yes gene_type:complete